ncbi:hypothetical protein PS862_03283 [Pseudomonas fluorescens]|uniref:DUF4879 domain-containing protein n=1 Tax=Pseudomonas fluorescens TaxID=294 RepID=A0A5E7L5Q0_PSEFL|nr:peptidase inhibitor family I36 protein [Pseudomonas fluorescens]VVP09632.1 hypothetical protein PS862_03283 [Pseudomonas fluorescens]
MKRVSMICKIASGVMAITSMAMPLIGMAKESESSGKYTLFDPSMQTQQKADIQKKIDTQLLLKPGGQQISPTQVAYDNGDAVITFAVSSTPNTTCDFGYVCFWEHVNYVGKKLSLRSYPPEISLTVNLAQYDMSNKISSWKHNNNFFHVAIGGASQAYGGGQMVMTNTMDDHLGGGCCPFAIDHSTQKGPPPEFIFRASLKYDNAMVSVVFKPYPW